MTVKMRDGGLELIKAARQVRPADCFVSTALYINAVLPTR